MIYNIYICIINIYSVHSYMYIIFFICIYIFSFLVYCRFANGLMVTHLRTWKHDVRLHIASSNKPKSGISWLVITTRHTVFLYLYIYICCYICCFTIFIYIYRYIYKIYIHTHIPLYIINIYIIYMHT